MAVSHIKSATQGEFTGTVTVFNSAGSTVTANATDIVGPNEWNSVHNEFWTITGNNTFSNTTASGSNIVFSGAGNLSIGGSSNTLIFSGSSPVQNSIYRNGNYFTTAGTAFNSSVVSIQPFVVPYDIVVSNILLFYSQSVATTTNTSSAFIDVSISGGIYSMNSATAGSLLSVATFTNSNTAFFQSNSTSSVTGMVYQTASFATKTLTAGQYWMALQMATSNSATGGANTTALGVSMSMLLGNTINSVMFNAHAQGSASTLFGRGALQGLGLATGSNLTTGTLNITSAGMTGTGTALIVAPVYFELRNSTWQM